MERRRFFLWLAVSLVAVFYNSSTFSQANFWQQMSKGLPFAGGDIYAVVISPSTGYIFAIGDDHWCYRSTDDGETWKRAMSTFWEMGMDHKRIACIAVNSNGHIFVGSLGSYGGGGILYRSTDNGESWTGSDCRGLGDCSIYALATIPNGYIFLNTYNSGVFRSTDNGGSWRQVGLTDFAALAVNSMGQIFAATGKGVFCSTDSGSTWKQAGLADSSVSAIAINSRGHVFAGTGSGEVFRSMDNGESWKKVSTGLMNFEISCMSADSNDGIFAGTNGGGIFRSTDNGETWSQSKMGLTDSVVQTLAINSSGHIFVGTQSGGVFRSTDGGAMWTKVGVSTIPVRCLVAHPSGDVFAGRYYGGIFRSGDSGTTWTGVGMPVLFNVLAVNSAGDIFAGTGGMGVFRSTDDGDSWTQVGLADGRIFALAINPAGHIFAGGEPLPPRETALYRSTDIGESWSLANTGLPESSTTPLRITYLAINSSGHIFAATGRGVFRSTNSGDSWAQIGLQGKSTLSLAIDGHGRIFAGTNSDEVWRSTDNGGAWMRTSFAFPYYAEEFDVTSLVVNSNGHIFAGISCVNFYTSAPDGGVFRSTDGGGGWTQVNSGLGLTAVRALAINPSGYLFAGTENCGIFRTVYSTRDTAKLPQDTVSLPTAFSLQQNYPNPFNSSTMLEFSLPQPGYVTMKVYNVLGEEVAVLVSEERSAGRHKVAWEARGISSGVYFYRMQAGDFLETKKLMLLR